MKNLLRFTILTMLFVLLVSGSAFATSNTTQTRTVSVETVKKIQDAFNPDTGIINKPKDFALVTTSDSVIISGSGKEADSIKINLYTLNGNEYQAFGDTIEFKLGPLGVFTREISLKYKASELAVEPRLSKNTLVVLELTRGPFTSKDYRIIRSSDESDLRNSLTSLRSTGFTSYSTLPAK